MTVLRRLGRRHFVRNHPAQLVLAVLGIAVGVAVVIAIDLANASAVRSFDLTVESLAGRATHRVVGGPAGVPDAVFRDVRIRHGFRAAAPVVEGTCRVVRDGDRAETLRVLGVDPLAEAELRPWLAAFDATSGTFDVGRLMTEPGTVLITGGTAEQLGVGVGDFLTVENSGFRSRIEVLGLLAPSDQLARTGLEMVLIADISTAQELLQQVGRLTRIDLAADAEGAERLQDQLAAPLRVESTERSRGVLQDLTRAFRTNLQALGLLALIVGAFLIYNTMQFAVVQRRTTFGVVRALGATPRQVFSAVLSEALIIGLLGTGLGVAIGFALAAGLLDQVSRTLRDFYDPTAVTAVVADGASILKAVALGLGASLIATLAPAREATRVSPRDAMRRTSLDDATRQGLPKLVGVAAAFFTLAAIVLMTTERAIEAAYVGILLALLGCACLVPPLTTLLLHAAVRPLRLLLGTPGALAARSAARSSSRTGIAVAALMLAVAATVGLGAMIGTFRGTVATWLGTTLAADVYVSVPSAMSARMESRVAPDTIAALRAMPGTRELSTIRRIETEDSEARSIELAAVEPAPGTIDTFTWVAGDDSNGSAALASGDELLISEPLAWRLGLSVGDTLELQTTRGLEPLRIAAVFRDYAAERGWAMIARSGYDRRFDDPAVSGISIWVNEGTNVDAYVARARGIVGESDQELLVRSSRSLRDSSLEVFDRTFAITAVLRLLCMIVAVLGIGSALAALQLERARETGMLRAIGASPRQVASMLIGQNGLLGLCAGLLALPTGAMLAWLLASVVNRRSFGWTLLDFELPPRIALEALGLAVVAAVLAGLAPAWKLTRLRVAEALREE